jgi:hypothetical protein
MCPPGRFRLRFFVVEPNAPRWQVAIAIRLANDRSSRTALTEICALQVPPCTPRLDGQPVADPPGREKADRSMFFDSRALRPFTLPAARRQCKGDTGAAARGPQFEVGIRIGFVSSNGIVAMISTCAGTVRSLVS